ncbi:MAG TPA: hypothetical protein VEZ16_12935 [Microvirga sp.]|nr:hypothetical protein [Microvirga sp.]
MNARPDRHPPVPCSEFSELTTLIGRSICLLGLILTAYGALLVMFPPFGPAILVFGLIILASGVVLLRMLLRPF